MINEWSSNVPVHRRYELLSIGAFIIFILFGGITSTIVLILLFVITPIIRCQITMILSCFPFIFKSFSDLWQCVLANFVRFIFGILLYRFRYAEQWRPWRWVKK